MGYFLRYVLTDQRPVTPEQIAEALTSAHSPCALAANGKDISVTYETSPVAEIEINTAEDALFEGERDEFIESVEQSQGRGKRKVLNTLRSAQGIVAIQVLFADRGTEETLKLVDPILTWLIRNRSGLVQADGEGFYEGGKLILEVT